MLTEGLWKWLLFDATDDDCFLCGAFDAVPRVLQLLRAASGHAHALRRANCGYAAPSEAAV